MDPNWVTDRRITEPWLAAPALHAIFDALGEAVIVGGAVRNALIGAGQADLDLATPLPPEEVVRRLEAAGLKAVPTGIAHGTVTAVVQGQPHEITTFRSDVETDGRHAVVRFSNNMAEDARRRDFTMNALYADREGRVIDPLGGLPDLEARRVRFIGDPFERIREDYLRILRFFRFFAWYGGGIEGAGIDEDGLAACAELAEGVERLARERVGHEFRRLLSAPDPAPAVASMAASGVLWRCLPGANAEILAPLVHLEAEAGRAPDWRVRLAALGAEEVSEALRLSRAEERAVACIQSALAENAAPGISAYRHGAEAAWAQTLIMATLTGPQGWEEIGRQIAQGAEARFPLTAKDLIAAGLAPGPEMGRALARAEALWIESGFTLDRDRLLKEVHEEGQH